MEITELKMVMRAKGVTKKVMIRNRVIRGRATIVKQGNKLRNGRLRWYRHVKKSDEGGYVGRRVMEMAVHRRRMPGRPKRRCLDAVRESMWEDGVENKKTYKNYINPSKRKAKMVICRVYKVSAPFSPN